MDNVYCLFNRHIGKERSDIKPAKTSSSSMHTPFIISTESLELHTWDSVWPTKGDIIEAITFDG